LIVRVVLSALGVFKKAERRFLLQRELVKRKNVMEGEKQ
jgi:hypothetical protein